MNIQGFRLQPGSLLRSDLPKCSLKSQALHLKPSKLGFRWHTSCGVSPALVEDNIRTKAAEVALQQVTDNKQLLELLDVTPPYFALQDLRATDTVAMARVERESRLRGEERSALSCQELCRHAANLGVAAVAAVNPNKRKTYCLAYYGQHKLIPYAGEDEFPDMSEHTEVAMRANVTRFSGTTAAVDIEVFTSAIPGAATFDRLYAVVTVRYMLVPEAEFEAQMAAQMAEAGRALTPEAMAGYFAQSSLNGVSPYGDPVYLEDIKAPEPDVRIGHMCIDNPCMVKGHQFGLPVAVVAGNVFDTISMFGPSPDERLAFTLVSGTLKCSRMVQLGERVTIRTERPSPRKFLSEVLDKDGGSICRFNLNVALH